MRLDQRHAAQRHLRPCSSDPSADGRLADASHGGQASELAVARASWAVSRQSRIDPAEIEKVCRAYANNFYEAVVTRQAASLCEDGVSRQ